MPITTYANNPSTTATGTGSGGSILSTDTTFTVASSTGFPAASSTAIPPTQFHIADPAVTTELITVTNISGTTWTVARGAESTTPAAHAANATFQQVVSAGDLANFKQATTASSGAVTVANSSAITVLATYAPTTSELVAGVCFEAIAFGTFATNYTTARQVVTVGLYWGGSGSVGGTYTPGTALCEIKTGTNAVAFTTTTSVAGASFDINGSITYISSTTATANLNLFYCTSSNSLTAAQSTATATNATTGGASSATPVTISGSGPIFLTWSWSAASTASTMTATAPVIYRMA